MSWIQWQLKKKKKKHKTEIWAKINDYGFHIMNVEK